MSPKKKTEEVITKSKKITAKKEIKKVVSKPVKKVKKLVKTDKIEVKSKNIKAKSTIKKVTKKITKKAESVSTKKESQTTKPTSRKRVKSASAKATKRVVTKKPKTIDKNKKPLKHISITKKTLLEGVDLDIKKLRVNKEKISQANNEVFDIYNAPQFYDYDYGFEKIVLLPIDPQFGFVYWDLKAASLEHAFAYKQGNLVLRFYDVTNIDFNGFNANSIWDVKIYGHRGTWYLNHDRGNRNLMVEIGVLEFNGVFTPVSRSNVAYFPSNTVSDNDKVQWMTVDEFGNKIISDIEDLTRKDLLLLKKILGDDLYEMIFVKKEMPISDGSNFRVVTEESLDLLGVGGVSSFFKNA